MIDYETVWHSKDNKLKTLITEVSAFVNEME